MKYTTAYVAPILTVDGVIFQIIGGILHVLLIKRPNDPFKGAWALPGGYNPQGETTIHAFARVLKQKTGLDTSDLRYIEQLYTFDTVARDPRGHAVSVAYMGCGRSLNVTETSGVTFHSINALPELAYDHRDIVLYARERLSGKLAYTNAAFGFLADTFTLAELQTTYEAILGRALDKRNFRKKFLSLNLIHETDTMKREGAHRPARLYAFNSTKLESPLRSFD